MGEGQGLLSGTWLVWEFVQCPVSEQHISVRTSRPPRLSSPGSPRAASSCCPVLATGDVGMAQAIPMGEMDMSTVLTQGAQEGLGMLRAMGGWGVLYPNLGLQGGSLEEVSSELRSEGSGDVNQMKGQQVLGW